MSGDPFDQYLDDLERVDIDPDEVAHGFHVEELADWEEVPSDG